MSRFDCILTFKYSNMFQSSRLDALLLNTLNVCLFQITHPDGCAHAKRVPHVTDHSIKVPGDTMVIKDRGVCFCNADLQYYI